MTGIIRTVLGDIEPAALGFTLGHEHLIAHPPVFVTDPDLSLGDETEARDDLALFREAGGGALVEMTTIDYGRDGPALKRLSAETGIHIVAATGFNKGKFSDRISNRYSTARIAEWMVREITTGMIAPGMEDVDAPTLEGRHAARAGLIKASSSLDSTTSDERRVFDAAIEAFKATGAPISTHTERATFALEQIRILLDGGGAPGKILIGHLDFRPDIAFLTEVAQTGVYMGFDQFGKSKYLPDEVRLDLVERLAERGFLRQLIFSGDMARRSARIANGGHGFSFFPETIQKALADRGIKDAVSTVFFDNVRSFLSFDPSTISQQRG